MLKKINVIYYKNLIDLVIADFIRENSEFFAKSGSEYLLSKNFAKSKFKRMMKKKMIKLIHEITTEKSIINPNYYFIICGCIPKDNIIYKYRDDSKYIPDKLIKIVEDKSRIRWFMRERDIKIVDVDFLNETFTELFNQLFGNEDRILGSKYSNVKMIANNFLDCYTIYQIIKREFGKSICINLYDKLEMSKMNLPIVSVNELIQKYSHNRDVVLITADYKNSKKSVTSFVKECVK